MTETYIERTGRLFSRKYNTVQIGRILKKPEHEIYNILTMAREDIHHRRKAPDKAVVERVACAAHNGFMADDWLDLLPDGIERAAWLQAAQAALAALQPGDELGPNLFVTAGETIYSAECQATERMRERCAKLMDEATANAVKHHNDAERLEEGDLADHFADLIEERRHSAAAIRALKVGE